MDKDIKTFLLKLLGTFAILILIIALGKKLKTYDFGDEYSYFRIDTEVISMIA